MNEIIRAITAINSVLSSIEDKKEKRTLKKALDLLKDKIVSEALNNNNN